VAKDRVDWATINRYWGKARNTQEGGDDWHLLAYHSLDVASVAARWWDSSPALRRKLCPHSSLSEPQMRAWVLFFVALHDLGKFDIRFQRKAPEVWQRLNPEVTACTLPSVQECREYDHGREGLFWFVQDHLAEPDGDGFGDSESVGDGFGEFSPDPFASWHPWLEAVCGHHGRLVQVGRVLSRPDAGLPYECRHWAEVDRVARRAWLQILETLFLAPAGLAMSDPAPECSPLLAGFCAVSDWLGSWLSDDTFHYCARPVEAIADLEAYFRERCQVDAPRVLARSGLLGQVRSGADVEALLTKGYRPRQVQVLVDRLPASSGLTLIEAPTGSGKTEAALAYAWRLLEQGLAESIVFALPTQATANAMLDRMEVLASRLFSAPNLILAHGNARFHGTFKAIRDQGRNLQGDDAWSQCCQWLSESRKRAFLGQIGVCTIDQVLVSVLPVRHRFVRGFGLGRSVLIVDEVHAYDAYMYGLLEKVLNAQARVGAPAILLSATLPDSQKRQLLTSYAPNASLPEAPDAPYPLVSWVAGEQRQTFDLTDRPDQQPPARHVFLDRRYTDAAEPDQALLTDLIRAADQGAQVCLICNRVDVAQRSYQQLRASAPPECDIQLFHARFTLHDRKAKEARVLADFGKSGARDRGRILVATQVVEQSLDVDFDWLVTQICPVDLLFQRLGRLHRHQRDHRPAGFGKPRATVLLPNGEGYGGLSRIYGHTRVMWRTQRRLETLGDRPVCFPDAYRDWIESVYAEPRPDEVEPDWVREGMEAFETDTFTKCIKARQMAQWGENSALGDDDVTERAVTRDGAMSLSLVPYVDAGDGKQLLNGQVLERLPEDLRLEALMLNQVNVPESWRGWIDAEPDEMGRYWLAGRLKTDGWESADGQFCYRKETGMTLAIPVESRTGSGTPQSGGRKRPQ
jgi:CRISPR-associated endonuclease/helicase Cas3